MSVTHHNSLQADTNIRLSDLLAERLWTLRNAPEGCSQSVVEEADQNEEESEEHRVLICQVCNHAITSEKHRIEMNGAHRHTFFNPAGIVFELGCFSEAVGVAILGEASPEFSWFSGYVWRVALCSRCGVHLGWQFSGAQTFYGLILKNLAQG